MSSRDRLRQSARKGRSHKKDGDKRSSEKSRDQKVSCSFANNEYSGKIKTSAIGIRVLDGTDGKYTWSNGVRYEGPFVGSKAEGEGKFFWPDGSTYVGQVTNGRRNGKGVYVAADGITQYSGEWRDGKRHGSGRLEYPPGADGDAFYQGQWEDGAKHGEGLQVWPSGNRYEGQWRCGKMSGHGSMLWMDGGASEKYVGQWVEGRPQGQGSQTWLASDATTARTGGAVPAQQCQNRYEGEWRDGVRHGTGLFCYANGSRYHGDWTGNSKHGQGRYTYEDGKVYQGSFAVDQMADAGVPGPPESKQSKRDVLNIGAEDNPVRRSIDISDLEPLAFPADIGGTDLTATGSGYDEPHEVMREVFNLLLRNVGLLKKTYNDYRQVLPESESDPFILQGYQMWALILDLGLVTPDCTLGHLNRVIFEGLRHHQEASFEDMEDLKPLEPDFEGEPRTPPPEPEQEEDEQEGDEEYDDGEERPSSRGSMVSKSSYASRASRMSRSSRASRRSFVSQSSMAESELRGRSMSNFSVAESEVDQLTGLSRIKEEDSDKMSSVGGSTASKARLSQVSVSKSRRPSSDTAIAEGQSLQSGSLNDLQPEAKPESGTGADVPATQEEGQTQDSAESPKHDVPSYSRFWRQEGVDALADIHSPRAELMFRHFLEGLVRLAVGAFPTEKGLERQVRKLFNDRLLPSIASIGGYSPSTKKLAHIVNEEVQSSLSTFEPELMRLFRSHASGEGAYAAPEWAPAATQDASARRHRRHFGGQNRRSHLKARLDVTVRIKDVLQILNSAGLLCRLEFDKEFAESAGLNTEDAAEDGAQDAPQQEQEEPAEAQDAGAAGESAPQEEGPRVWDLRGPLLPSRPMDEALEESASLVPTPVSASPVESPRRSVDGTGSLSMATPEPTSSKSLGRQEEPAGAAEAAPEEPPPVPGKPEDVLQCDFTVSFLQVLRILTELAPPETVEQVQWALEPGVSPSTDALCVLDLLETELTFWDFNRLLVRLAQTLTSEAEFEAEMPLGTRVEGFLSHVFLPSLHARYAFSPPDAAAASCDAERDEGGEQQEGVAQTGLPATADVRVAGAGLDEVEGVYRRSASAEPAKDGTVTLYAQDDGAFGLVLYPASNKEGPAWILQRRDNGKRAYVIRLEEDPGEPGAVAVPLEGWEVYEVPKDKTALPGKAPAPAIEKYEEPEKSAHMERDFWLGFDDDAGMELAVTSCPRAWPEDYEMEVADW